MSTREHRLHRLDLRQGSIKELDDVVAVDEAVCVFVNDEYYRTLIATPSMVKELVIGHLVGEGIIRSLGEVKNVEVKPLKVYVELSGDVDLELITRSKIELITTACGSAGTPLSSKQLRPLGNTGDIKISAEKVWSMVRELNVRSEMFRGTGGTHSAMLCSIDGEVLAFAEDVGRHNAVDKVVGAGILGEAHLGSCVLVSSGRQSSEIVLKAARGGIPIIASVAGPLESGIRIADAAGITLICFVRGTRMNIYTHPERIRTA